MVRSAYACQFTKSMLADELDGSADSCQGGGRRGVLLIKKERCTSHQAASASEAPTGWKSQDPVERYAACDRRLEAVLPLHHYDSCGTAVYDQVVCVVLTGMGADGTKRVISLTGKKPVYVIAQDAASCVVYGIPEGGCQAGVMDEVVPSVA